MITTADISLHDVTGLKLIRTYLSNGGSRTIIIETKRGAIEIVLYGETEDADSLPRHEEYRES